LSWRVWTGKYEEEIRHLRGLVDEIMIIIDDSKEDRLDVKNVSLEIMRAITETQNEYEGAEKDENNR
tara:strand:+ start:22590 stop:22790 length:201 start_codon:yes stop_codon:yes gene_type:complete